MLEKAWQQEQRQLVTSHQLGSRQVNTAQLTLSSLFSLGPQPMGCYWPQLGSFSPQENLSGNTPTDIPDVCLLGDSRSCQVHDQY